jgi:Reverse transcriptase (RNA-dependent DNA polymerase)
MHRARLQDPLFPVTLSQFYPNPLPKTPAKVVFDGVGCDLHQFSRREGGLQMASTAQIRFMSLRERCWCRFVLGWKKLGHEKRLKAYITNYADDLVICGRSQAEAALATMRNMMSRLQLTVNDSKTRVCKLPEEKFDFLGYRFGRWYSPKTGRAFLGTTPSKKRVQRICQAISQETGRNKTLLAQETVITTLNRMMVGWLTISVLDPSAKPTEL